MNTCLALDVGGSFIKLGLMDERCAPLPASVRQLPVESQGTRDEIMAALVSAFSAGLSAARDAGAKVTCVGVSIPGPFDYAGVVSRMQHKFASIEGMPLLPHLRAVLGNLPIAFLHDSTAFMLGEYHHGAARGALRPTAVMLGTGFGFAALQGERVCVNEAQTPALSIWARPFKGGITEDYLSSRAIRARYAAQDAPPVKEIADRARQGDSRARDVLLETGALLSEALAPTLTALRCDRIILGGQIARAADLILPGYAAHNIAPLCLAAHLDDAALRGAALYARSDPQALVRETTEAEMRAFANRGD